MDVISSNNVRDNNVIMEYLNTEIQFESLKELCTENKLKEFLYNYKSILNKHFILETKIPNLIIWVCKSGNIKCLEHLFDENTVEFIVKVNGDFFHLNFKDETNHTALYYAIRNSDVDFLNFLIINWPKGNLMTNNEELDLLMSSSYQELVVNKVLLTNEMKVYVFDRLLSERFHRSSSLEETKNITNIIERITLLSDNILMLQSFFDVNEKSLCVLTYIVKNIHILKHMIKYSYDVIPWEEMEFCCISFISSCTKNEEINLLGRLVLDFPKIKYYLKYFIQLLTALDLKEVNINTIAIMSKASREDISKKIIVSVPQFKDLYLDFKVLRDLCSLSNIKKALNLATSSDSSERKGRLAIFRAIQIIGEHLKNTLETPKLSTHTIDILLLSLPQTIKKVMVNLRNNLSHSYFLSKNIETRSAMFKGIQSDLKLIIESVEDIFSNIKASIYYKMIIKIQEITDVMDFRNVVHNWRTIKLDKLMPLFEKQASTFDDLYEYLTTTSEKVEGETIKDVESFLHTLDIIKTNGRGSINTCNSWDFIVLMNSLTDIYDEDINESHMHFVKNKLKVMSSKFVSKFEDQDITAITEILKILLKNAIKHPNNWEALRLARQISVANELTKSRVWCHSIEELSSQLSGRSSLSSISEKNKFSIINVDTVVSELNNILTSHGITKSSAGLVLSTEFDKSFIASIQILSLSILSSWESQKKLQNNFLSLDDDFFILTGKCLRNHLAHSNYIMDILYEEHEVILIEILNSMILIQCTEKVTQRSHNISSSPYRMRTNLKRDLLTLNIKEKMFNAMKEGRLSTLQVIMEKGADIFSRDESFRNCVHYSCMTKDIATLNYLQNLNIDINLTCAAAESGIHVAARYGHTDTLRLLLKAGQDLNVKERNGRSPLHLAVKHNQNEAAFFLINNGANISQTDNFKKTPICYAYCNNNKDLINFLEREDVNIKILGGFTVLHMVANKGYLELAQSLVSKGADVNAKADKGGSPLLTATINGHYDVIAFLLDNGADANAQSFVGHTPLYNACGIGRYDIVNLLLQKGAEVNIVEVEQGLTPLHVASSSGHNNIVKLLLQHKADHKITNILGITPFIEAVLNGHVNVAKTLLASGADINIKTNNKYGAAHFAALNGSTQILELLIKNGASLNCHSDSFLTPLHLACLSGNLPIISLLLDNNAKVNAEDDRGLSPLHLAANNNYSEIVTLLLTKGAQVDFQDIYGNSPLLVATIKDAYDVALILLQKLANVNLRNYHSFSPLDIACFHRYTNIAQLFIEHGAEVNSSKIFLLSPLYLAVRTGKLDTVILLIEKGAHFKTYDDKKEVIYNVIENNHKEILTTLMNKKMIDIIQEAPSALFYSIVNGSKSILEFLLRHKIHKKNIITSSFEFDLENILFDSSKNCIETLYILRNLKKITPLQLASYLGKLYLAETLISFGADLNNKCDHGSTALHLAAIMDHSEVVMLLIQEGADHSVRDLDHKTAFELAIGESHVNTVNVFLYSKGIDVNEKGSKDWTPLHLAAQAGNLDIVVNLVECGADLNSKNAEDFKPIHIAVQHGFKDIVEYFLHIGMNVQEVQEQDNMTLLHHAVVEKQLDLVKILTEHGAKVNTVDSHGYSPLHYAAQSGNECLVKYLLNSGSYFNYINPKLTKKALELTNCTKTIDLLVKTEDLFLAAKKNDCVAVESLIGKGAVVNACHSELGPILHYCAWKGYNEVAKILLINKCNPNITGKNELRPLHYATKYTNYELVLTLLSHGACFNPMSKTGKTPLDLCTDKKIGDLLTLINQCFEKVKTKDTSVIGDLANCSNSKLKAIVNSKDKSNEYLMVSALKSNFPDINKLRSLLERDFTSKQFLAKHLFEQEKYGEALNICKDMLETKKRNKGENQVSIINDEIAIATTLLKEQQFEKSLILYKTVYEKQKNLFGEHHMETLDTNRQIALVLHRMGKQTESLAIFEKVYQKQKKMLGDNHGHVMETLANKAIVLNELGMYKEALKANYQVLNYRISTLGADNHTVATTYNNIAMTLNFLNRHDEAIDMYQKAYDGRIKALGPTHSDTLRTKHNMATVLLSANKTREALEMLYSVLETQKAKLGYSHRDVFVTQVNIAYALLCESKLIAALKLCKECYSKGINIFGKSHPDVRRVEKFIHIIKHQLNSSSKDVNSILMKLRKDFFLSVSSGDDKRIISFLENGAFVNEQDENNRTPLHYAVFEGNLNTIALLLEKGADVTSISKKGNTPLHMAASKNRVDIMTLLLRKVGEQQLYNYVNMKTEVSGSTALHLSSKNGCLEAVQCLLNFGASYDIINAEGSTPLALTQNIKVSNLLETINQFFDLVSNNDGNIVKNLETLDPLTFSSVVFSKNSRGQTLLTFALEKDNLELAESIINLKANKKL